MKNFIELNKIVKRNFTKIKKNSKKRKVEGKGVKIKKKIKVFN